MISSIFLFPISETLINFTLLGNFTKYVEQVDCYDYAVTYNPLKVFPTTLIRENNRYETWKSKHMSYKDIIKKGIVVQSIPELVLMSKMTGRQFRGYS